MVILLISGIVLLSFLLLAIILFAIFYPRVFFDIFRYGFLGSIAVLLGGPLIFFMALAAFSGGGVPLLINMIVGGGSILFVMFTVMSLSMLFAMIIDAILLAFGWFSIRNHMIATVTSVYLILVYCAYEIAKVGVWFAWD